MNETELLRLFNEVMKVAKPISTDGTFPKSLQDEFQNLDIDSLDFLLLGVYMGEIYGIPEETMKEVKLNVKTVQDFFNFLNEHKTRDLPPIDDVLKEIQ